MSMKDARQYFHDVNVLSVRAHQPLDRRGTTRARSCRSLTTPKLPSRSERAGRANAHEARTLEGGAGGVLGEPTGDGVGGGALQGVAGVVVAAGGAGVAVPGEVLDVADGGAGVEGQGDRGVAQRVRGELRPGLDAGGAGEAADQLPDRLLGEPPAGAGGEQRPG